MTAPSHHDEAPVARAYDSRLMARLMAFLRPYRGSVALAVVVLLAASALELVQPYLTKVAIDRYIAAGDASGLPPVAAAYLASLALVFGARYLEDYLTARIGQRACLDLRTALFRHLQSLHVQWFDRTPVGRTMTRVIGDVDVLNDMFTSGVVSIFGDLFVLAGIVAVMLWLDWRLALAVLVVMPPLALATWLFRVRVREAFREVRGKLARVNAFLQEQITGMSAVQLYRREELDRGRFDRINAEHRDAHLRTVLYHSVYYPVIEVLGAVAVGLIVWQGGRLAAQGAVTLGVLVAFIQYAKRFFQPIMDLSEKYTIVQSAMASSERVFELLDTPAAVVPPERPVALPPGRPGIRLEGVWFAYRDRDWVLSDVSLEVPPGRTLAVVGATGAGKSTLAGLVLRLHDPGRGTVRVGGIDVRELDPQELRRRVAFVQQDVFLFSGSIADNIRLGLPLTARQVEEAARAVGIDRLVEALPRGYDTPVGERGSRLSTGQKQLVALARALAFEPDVLILDEATSSIDSLTEELVQEATERVARGRTSLVIAHRLSTVRRADAILVLHRGRVREVGTHAELLARDGLYRRLHDLQFGRSIERGEAASGVPR